MPDKTLVIVESPAKAKKIAGYLGPDYTVLASVGHIRDLASKASELPEAQRKQPWAKLAVNVDEAYQPYYIVHDSKKQTIASLKKALKESDALLLATDEDREGEAIAWHLMEVLRPKVPVQRMVFNEITKEAIQAAVAETRDLDMQLVEAQETRRIVDRLFGYQVSEVLWRKVAQGTSAGRVQSVALRLVVERERAIRAFVPRFYSTVELGVSPAADPELVIPASLVGPKGESLELESDVAAAAVARITGGTATVTERSESTRKQRPVPPFQFLHDTGIGPERARQVLERFKDLGIGIACDDFGTGHSSLSYLAKLPGNTLKIDQSFVRDMESSENTLTIVTTTFTEPRERARALGAWSASLASRRVQPDFRTPANKRPSSSRMPAPGLAILPFLFDQARTALDRAAGIGRR